MSRCAEYWLQLASVRWVHILSSVFDHKPALIFRANVAFQHIKAFYLSGRSEWTQRLSALQLPAGLSRWCSSRTSLCSTCTRTQERVTGGTPFLVLMSVLKLPDPSQISKRSFSLSFFLSFIYKCMVGIYFLVCLIVSCRMSFVPLFPARPFSEAKTICALWDLIVSVFGWSPLVTPVQLHPPLCCPLIPHCSFSQDPLLLMVLVCWTTAVVFPLVYLITSCSEVLRYCWT